MTLPASRPLAATLALVLTLALWSPTLVAGSTARAAASAASGTHLVFATASAPVLM